MKQLKQSAEEGEAFIKKYHWAKNWEIQAAATRFVLSHPDVSNILCRCDTFEDVESGVSIGLTAVE